MSNAELKSALLRGCPVESGGKIYKCVKSIIIWKDNEKIKVSAELQDRFTNSVTRVDVSRIKEVII